MTRTNRLNQLCYPHRHLVCHTISHQRIVPLPVRQCDHDRCQFSMGDILRYSFTELHAVELPISSILHNLVLETFPARDPLNGGGEKMANHTWTIARDIARDVSK